MFDLLSQEGLRPFLISAVLVMGLLGLEIVLMMLGLSGGSEADVPEIETGEIEADFAGMGAGEIAAEMDIDPGVAAQIEAELTAQGVSPDLDADSPAPAGSTSAIGTALDLLGMRLLPLSVSLALFAACFTAAGLFTQVLLHGLMGVMLPLTVMVPAALVAAAIGTRKLSRFIVRLIPRDETSAISERSLGRRRGIVTVGTARGGQPAEVKVIDGYGNFHYLMVEPLSADDEIPEGSEVLVLRLRGGEYRLVQIG